MRLEYIDVISLFTNSLTNNNIEKMSEIRKISLNKTEFTKVNKSIFRSNLFHV